MQVRLALIAGLALVVVAITLGTVAGRTSRTPSTPITVNGSWPTYHRDNARTGNDPTLAPVVSVTAGWTRSGLDGEIYASPLVHGGKVYTATLNNTVYALNQTDGTIEWFNHLGTPQASGWACGNVSPMGILGTPVIDTVGNRIYAVAEIAGTTPIYRLFGLNLGTGAIELNTVVNPPGFDWKIQQERGALALANGYVYVPFGGRAGDCFDGGTPYYGWVVGVPTDGVSTSNVFKTPSGAESVWAPGGVLVDDSTTNVFFATGNAIPCGGSTYSDAVVKVNATLGSPTFFEPNDWQASWCNPDEDLGSATPVLISPSLMFTSGKHGGGFLLDPTNLGGVNGQLFPSPAGYTQSDVCFGDTSAATYGSFAYKAPFVYLECEAHGLVALNLNTSTPSFSECDAACLAPNWHVGGTRTYGAPMVAAGAVWVAGNTGLTAYRASNGALIYQSASFGVNRFVTPAEAGGQVFVPSHTTMRSFVMQLGLSQSSPAPSPPSRSTPIGQSSPTSVATRSPVTQTSPAPSPPPR